MKDEDDFVRDEIIDLNVRGKIFKYQPTSGGEEIDWLNEYMVTTYDKDKKKEVTKRDFAKLNKLKLRNIVGVPYSKELIQKMTGFDKEFNGLTPDQRVTVLCKLKGPMLNAIIDAMTDYDNANNPIKKN